MMLHSKKKKKNSQRNQTKISEINPFYHRYSLLSPFEIKVDLQFMWEVVEEIYHFLLKDRIGVVDIVIRTSNACLS